MGVNPEAIPVNAPGQAQSVRSYVIRAGRLTDAQRLALETLWPRYGVEGRGIVDLDSLFGRHAPRVAEVGFGNGDALLALATAHSDTDYLGLEVYPPGIGRLLAGLVARELDNVRVLRGDAVTAFRERIPDLGLDQVNIWFPDPWPKKRHHKRRLLQPEFLALVAGKLKPGARLHLATDWEDYARHMLETADAEPSLINLAGAGRYFTGVTERPITHFQQRGQRLGNPAWDLLYEKRNAAED